MLHLILAVTLAPQFVLVERTDRADYRVLADEPHEITHLVSARLGNPGIFWQEGLAWALGSKLDRSCAKREARRLGLMFSLQFIPNFDWYMQGQSGWLDQQVQSNMAGGFMDYLIQTYGIERVGTFFRLSHTQYRPGPFGSRCHDPGLQFTQDARQFQEVFGLSIPAAVNNWLYGNKERRPARK